MRITTLLPLVCRRTALAAGCAVMVAGAAVVGGAVASAHPRPAPHNIVKHPGHPRPAPHNIVKHPGHPRPAPHNVIKHPGHPRAASGSVQSLARTMVPSNQFASFNAVISHESGWNVHARNPSSGAYGLGQALPAGKMAAAGRDWHDNPATQIRWTLGYMNGRYGSPNGAWAFWRTHHWY